MSKRNLGGINRHDLREAQRRERAEQKRFRRQGRTEVNGTIQQPIAYTAPKPYEPMRICYYGRKEWYSSLITIVGIKDGKEAVSSVSFDDIPENTHSIDVLVVDAQKDETGHFIAETLLELLKRQKCQTIVYHSETNLEALKPLLKYSDTFVSSHEPMKLRKYLDSLGYQRMKK
jgi:hypothetical protein